MPRRRRAWRTHALAGAAALAVLALCLAALVSYADRRIAPLVNGELIGRYPTRVYSAEFRLRAGDALSPSQLAGRLKRLGYEAVQGPPARPGTYRRASDGTGGERIEASLRGYEGPRGKVYPVKASLEFDSNRVSAVLLSSGPPLVEVSLEPELIYELSGPRRLRREPLAWAEVPKFVPDAVVAVEDRRFYSHHGVDLRGTLRAAWRDLRRLRLSEGGSTLTQQLARNLFLTPERSFPRKIKELFFALYLERKFSKVQILRMYLDQVYFGQDGTVSVCGLKAASRFFFDKSPSRLTLGEAAMLAGLLKSPYLYNPFRDPDLALKRRAAALEAMREQSFISRSQELQARLEPLRITRAGHHSARPADFFIAYVQEELGKRYTDEGLITRGLTIYTTLDPWLEDISQKAVSRARRQAALVALDPPTGAIRAMVGGKDFAASPFNRAVQARRQPGSAFKPFVYGAALRAARPDGSRWTAASLLLDAQRTFLREDSRWSPRNYDGVYHGTVTVRQALAQSLNAATVELAAAVGPRSIIDYARSLGVASPLKPELGLALGVFEASLLEVTAAYAPWANGGTRVEPYAVELALDLSGAVMERRQLQASRALSQAESWLMTDLLRETVRSGTARALKNYGLEAVAAGKTGTTDRGRDAWFIGYTPRLLCGVWTGEDRPAASKMSGASAALPLWAAVMAQSGQASPAGGTEPWPRPQGIVEVDIDPSSGLRAVSGCPDKRTEYFLAGTEPATDCPLHAKGLKGWLKRIFRRN